MSGSRDGLLPAPSAAVAPAPTIHDSSSPLVHADHNKLEAKGNTVQTTVSPHLFNNVGAKGDSSEVGSSNQSNRIDVKGDANFTNAHANVNQKNICRIL